MQAFFTTQECCLSRFDYVLEKNAIGHGFCKRIEEAAISEAPVSTTKGISGSTDVTTARDHLTLSVKEKDLLVCASGFPQSMRDFKTQESQFFGSYETSILLG